MCRFRFKLARRCLFAAILALVQGAATAAQAQEQVVNIYTSRHYDQDREVYRRFTEQTGIRVRSIEAESDQLLTRILAEGPESPADIFMTVDAGRMWRAVEAGVLAPHGVDAVNQRVPAHLRHPDDLWFGITKRARVIVYRKAAGRPDGLTTYADLADPVFADQICVRSSQNIYNLSLMAALIDRIGAAAAEDWARAVSNNFARPPQGNDTAQIRAVAAGQCRLAVVNSYYVGRLMGSENDADRAVADAVGLIFPDQDGPGTHVNVSGAGLIATAPNPDNARKFLEFLVSDEVQQILADGNHEFAAVPGVALSGPIAEMGDFKEDRINAAVLGENQLEAVRVYDRAGWP